MSLSKKLLSWVIIILLSILHYPLGAFASEEMKFIITAYYSPLKGQDKYLHGSYEREIYVNGKGTHGASGREVFEGMLAAPKKYPFGTKIHFEGYGVAEVQDRGWAIVSAGSRGNSYDRIDIWMWYGDEWRERATLWGKKTLKGKIVSTDTPNSLKFDEATPVNYYDLRVNPNSPSRSIKKLQELLQTAWLYNGSIDGNYASIQNTLIDFQLEHDIIPSRDHEVAWYFWPKTFSVIKKIIDIPQDTLAEENIQNFYWAENQEITQGQEVLMKYWEFRANPDSSNTDIRKLQNLLRDLWEYSGEIDGKYQSVEDDLIEFQIKLWIVKNKSDWGAGYYGSQTRSTLWKYYENNDIKINKAEKQIPQSQNINTQDTTASSHTLSLSEETRIIAALTLVKKRLTIAENNGWVSAQKTLNALSNQIEKILPTISDQELLAKLIFIRDEIR